MLRGLTDSNLHGGTPTADSIGPRNFLRAWLVQRQAFPQMAPLSYNYIAISSRFARICGDPRRRLSLFRSRRAAWRPALPTHMWSLVSVRRQRGELPLRQEILPTGRSLEPR